MFDEVKRAFEKSDENVLRVEDYFSALELRTDLHASKK